jgi:cell fate regulator YaaT (PSP1 superfamily)
MRVMASILRKTSPDEAAAISRHERLTGEAMTTCRQQTATLGLGMKLVEVYCSFQRRQITFVYSADDRIDFRELVRGLARRFVGRIEMRQITVREEASGLRGSDTCGLVLCCSSFMRDIRPVTVKQARALGLPVEDPRLLGRCGRLMCCLLFEAVDVQGAPPGQDLITPSRAPHSPIRHS